MNKSVFKPKELSIIRKLNTPSKLQDFINTLHYNHDKRIPIADVLRLKKADCLEAAIFSSFILSKHGFKTFLMDLEAERNDDHVICVYQVKGLYGAVAQSKFLGLRSRHPVYRSTRELAMSYFDNFFNYSGKFDLRRYSVPIIINDYSDLLSSHKEVKELELRIWKSKHFQLVKKNIVLPKVNPLKFHREILVFPKNVKIPREYLKKD